MLAFVGLFKVAGGVISRLLTAPNVLGAFWGGGVIIDEEARFGFRHNDGGNICKSTRTLFYVLLTGCQLLIYQNYGKKHESRIIYINEELWSGFWRWIRLNEFRFLELPTLFCRTVEMSSLVVGGIRCCWAICLLFESEPEQRFSRKMILFFLISDKQCVHARKHR